MLTDGDVVIAESGAIVQYIIAKYGGGRLMQRQAYRAAMKKGDPGMALLLT